MSASSHWALRSLPKGLALGPTMAQEGSLGVWCVGADLPSGVLFGPLQVEDEATTLQEVSQPGILTDACALEQNVGWSSFIKRGRSAAQQNVMHVDRSGVLYIRVCCTIEPGTELHFWNEDNTEVIGQIQPKDELPTDETEGRGSAADDAKGMHLGMEESKDQSFATQESEIQVVYLEVPEKINVKEEPEEINITKEKAAEGHGLSAKEAEGENLVTKLVVGSSHTAEEKVAVCLSAAEVKEENLPAEAKEEETERLVGEEADCQKLATEKMPPVPVSDDVLQQGGHSAVAPTTGSAENAGTTETVLERLTLSILTEAEIETAGLRSQWLPLESVQPTLLMDQEIKPPIQDQAKDTTWTQTDKASEMEIVGAPTEVKIEIKAEPDASEYEGQQGTSSNPGDNDTLTLTSNTSPSSLSRMQLKKDEENPEGLCQGDERKLCGSPKAEDPDVGNTGSISGCASIELELSETSDSDGGAQEEEPTSGDSGSSEQDTGILDTPKVGQKRRKPRSTERKYLCQVCGKTFIQLCHLKKHEYIHNEQKQYVCPHCGKSYTSEENYIGHLFAHRGIRPNKCDQCDKTYATKRDLKDHMVLHSNQDPFQCEICGKAFSRQQAVRIHRRNVHLGKKVKAANAKVYKCSICGKGLANPGSLSNHMRIHTGEKPYTCTICGKRFGQMGNLKGHLRLHTGEKPYKCDVCNDAFHSRPDLRRHMILHTGQGYPCSICGKELKDPHTLRAHERLHSGDRPFKCKQCGKAYTQATKLRRHEMTHLQEKTYKCGLCGMAYTRLTSLKRHEELHKRTAVSKVSATLVGTYTVVGTKGELGNDSTVVFLPSLLPMGTPLLVKEEGHLDDCVSDYDSQTNPGSPLVQEVEGEPEAAVPTGIMDNNALVITISENEEKYVKLQQEETQNGVFIGEDGMPFSAVAEEVEVQSET